MKPWLARTLLGSAIALAVLSGLWLLLDARWSGEVERLRAHPAPGAAELLPAIAAAEDAGPIYVEACGRWRSWRSRENDAAVNGVLALWNGKRIFLPDEWTAEEEARLAALDVPEIARIRELLRTAARREHSRLWDSEGRGLRSFQMSECVTLSQAVLVPAALRAAKHADREEAWGSLDAELGLAAHLREDPLIVSLMLSRVIAKQALEALALVLDRLTIEPAHARRLLASVARLRPEQDVLRALEGERVLFAEPTWDALVEGKFPPGIWLDTDVADSLQLKILRPWRRLDETKYFELLEATRAQLSANPWQAQPEQDVSDLFPITKTMYSGVSKLSGPWVLEERRSRDLAEIGLRLAIALAESGSYPEDLGALGDVPREPLSGKPYTYSRAGHGYVLGQPARR